MKQHTLESLSLHNKHYFQNEVEKEAEKFLKYFDLNHPVSHAVRGIVNFETTSLEDKLNNFSNGDVDEISLVDVEKTLIELKNKVETFYNVLFVNDFTNNNHINNNIPNSDNSINNSKNNYDSCENRLNDKIKLNPELKRNKTALNYIEKKISYLNTYPEKFKLSVLSGLELNYKYFNDALLLIKSLKFISDAESTRKKADLYYNNCDIILRFISSSIILRENFSDKNISEFISEKIINTINEYKNAKQKMEMINERINQLYVLYKNAISQINLNFTLSGDHSNQNTERSIEMNINGSIEKNIETNNLAHIMTITDLPFFNQSICSRISQNQDKYTLIMSIEKILEDLKLLNTTLHLKYFGDKSILQESVSISYTEGKIKIENLDILIQKTSEKLKSFLKEIKTGHNEKYQQNKSNVKKNETKINKEKIYQIDSEINQDYLFFDLEDYLTKSPLPESYSLLKLNDILLGKTGFKSFDKRMSEFVNLFLVLHSGKNKTNKENSIHNENIIISGNDTSPYPIKERNADYEYINYIINGLKYELKKPFLKSSLYDSRRKALIEEALRVILAYYNY